MAISSRIQSAGLELFAQPSARAASVPDAAEFAELYERHVDFVFRTGRRLGVEEDAIEDVVQEVFVVVHRRLGDFEGRASLRTWIYSIVVFVVREHRRTKRRAGLHGIIDSEATVMPDAIADVHATCPHAAAERADAARIVDQVLRELDDDKREVLVLAELEQLPVVEIAEILGLKLNTAYSRLRLARAAFDEAVLRHATATRKGR